MTMGIMFWLFLMGSVITGCIFSYKEKKLKADLESRRLQEPSRDLLQRLERIEARMANLETLVLDQEKQHEFDRRL